MVILIREAVEEDFPKLISLFKQFAAFQKIPEQMMNTAERMKEEKSFFRCYVAVNNNGTIAGYLSYFYAYFTFTGKSLYIDDLYVVEKYRGSGIGKKLMQKVVQLAKTEKCRKVRWQVSKWNKKAQDFYKSMGVKIDDIEINCDLEINIIK